MGNGCNKPRIFTTQYSTFPQSPINFNNLISIIPGDAEPQHVKPTPVVKEEALQTQPESLEQPEKSSGIFINFFLLLSFVK
jgi:hypothetical protein